MLTFSTYLIEAAADGPEMVHHHAISHGNDGVAAVGHALDAVHRHLLGKTSGAKITTEYDHPTDKDTVHRATLTNYTIHDQRRFLNHMENAKRVYSKMKPESMGIVGRQKYQLKHYLHGLSIGAEPPTVKGYMDHLTKQHDNRTRKTVHTHEEDKKRLSYSDAIKHVTANEKHFENAMEMHYHLRKAQNTLTGVVAKNYRSAGRQMGSKGATVTGHFGTFKLKRHV